MESTPGRRIVITTRNLDVEPLTPEELALQMQMSGCAARNVFGAAVDEELDSSSTGNRIGANFTARNAGSDAVFGATYGEYNGTLPDGENTPDNPHEIDPDNPHETDGLTTFEKGTNDLVLDGLKPVSPEHVMYPSESTGLFGSHRVFE
ncbi:MAG: hypothetical protein WAW63_05580 [Candidatus Saccharimonadales bacterium]|nr:hypothetical protein [Candidatus Saccharibacteria bacterium]